MNLWHVAAIVGLLVGVFSVLLHISKQIERLISEVARLRRDVGGGLGVDTSHPEGYLHGSHLEVLAHEAKDRTRAKWDARINGKRNDKSGPDYL